MDKSERSKRAVPGIWTAIHWVARIWSLPAILFALGEVFGGEDLPVLWKDWLMLGILLAAVAGLALAWWKPIWGGWIAVGGTLLSAFILYRIFNGEFFPASGLVIYLGFVIAPGMLFALAGWQKGRYLASPVKLKP